MKIDFDYTIERDESAIDVYVEGTLLPGTSDSYWEPGDPPEFEIDRVTLDGKPFETTSTEDEAIVDYVFDNLDRWDNDYPEYD